MVQLERALNSFQVEEWLRSLYATSGKARGRETPSYEKTKITLEILNDLKLTNESANLQAEEEIKVAKILKEEHLAEGNLFVFLCKLSQYSSVFDQFHSKIAVCSFIRVSVVFLSEKKRVTKIVPRQHLFVSVSQLWILMR